MALFKCKMCGGDLEIAEGVTIAECEYCGTKQTVPKAMDENLQNLFNRANTLRMKSEFDKAEKLYEKIIQADSTQSEAYWGLILCKYGIEYVDDPKTYKKIPTCHRASYDSIIADDDYKAAMENADMSQRALYEEQAKEIDRIQKDILALAQKEETYDVFICYKETDANGSRTHDSVIANDIYHQLTQEGFKVFYAAITLEGKLGSAYEPIIFAALNSAKVMLAIGTKPEYFKAVWVKNEWSRFLKIIKADRSKLLIPCYRDMDAYELPEEFAHLQAQDMGKIGFINDVVRGIKKVIKKDESKPVTVVKETVVTGNNANIVPLLKRAFMFAEDGEYNSANEYAEKVLDIDPECAEAYIVKLLIELRLRRPSDLAGYKTPFANSSNYQKAIRFASPEYKATIEGYNNTIITRLDTERKEESYSKGLSLMQAHRYDEAIQHFQKITSYKDSAKKIEDCKKLKETERLDGIYSRAMQAMNAGQLDEAASLFASIESYKDSKEKIRLCGEKKETARKDGIYKQAMQRVSPKNANDVAIKQSIEELHSISGYRDADNQIRSLNQRLEKWYEDKRIAEEEAQARADALRRERERQAEIKRIKAEKAKKTTKTVITISVPSIIALALFLVLLFTLVIPLIRYNRADNLLSAGELDAAMQIYTELDGFSESAQRIQVIAGISQLENAEYEAGIKTILEAGVPVEITYDMGGGDFSGEEHIALPGKPDMTNLSVSTSGNTMPLAETQDVPATVTNKYTTVSEFTGLQTPGRNGYRFVKWEFVSYDYQIKGTFEIKFNAVWSSKDYIITYDLAGGALSEANFAEYDPEDSAFTLINPTRTGYTFAGWVGTDLSEPTVDVTIPTGSYGDRCYTATWKANEYTVTYDAAGGTVSSKTQTVVFNTEVEHPIPERAGYIFVGWYEEEIEHGNEIWTIANDLSLTAQWEPIVYKITYLLHHAQISIGAPQEYTVESDDLKLPTPHKQGYVFLGWTYDGQDTPVEEVVIKSGSIGDKHYTANWEPITSTITFNTAGGQCDTNSLSVVYDKYVTLPTPTRKGYNFLGWYSDNHKYASGIWQKAIDFELRARWEVITYNITYNMNDGTNVVTNPLSYTVNDTVTLSTPTRTGYTFLGWTYTGQNTPVKNVVIKSGSIGDRHFTANWRANTYTITFDANGGSVSPTTQSVTYGESFTLPTPILDGVGYQFDGWYSESILVPEGTWEIDANTTLMARWSIPYTVNHYWQNANDDDYTLECTETALGTLYSEISPEVKEYPHFVSPSIQTISLVLGEDLVVNYYYDRETYELTYVTNGGDAIEKQTYKYDQTLVDTTPTRAGYTFGGWFTDATLSTEYSATAMLNADTTIYAYWTEENKPTDFKYYGTDTLSINAYNGTSTTMWIPAYVGGVPVTKIADRAFYDCNNLTSITIPDSVTSIGSYAFSNCNSLTSITIPDSVTSIDEGTFESCHDLTSVTIPDSVTSIGGSAFSKCNSLTSITIPDSVTSIGAEAFFYCEGLTSITIPDSVTSIGAEAFYSCDCLTSVTIGNSVTSIGNYAFSNCNSLTSITIPDSVTSIGSSAFYNCEGLTSITIPDSVTSIGAEAFYSCDCLTSVTIGNSVTSIGNYAFFRCTGLTSVTIGNSVTSIGSSAFYSCEGLTSITIPDSVTSIGSSAFSWCRILKNITFSGTVSEWNAITFGSDWNYLVAAGKIVCSDGTVPLR